MLLNWFLTLLTLSAVTALDYEDNIYVVLSSSKFFFNYRHSLNAFQFYSHLKQSGITDDKIMLMVPTDHGCNPKNIFPGTLYHEVSHQQNWLCDDLEVDYKSEDLTADSILNLLRGRYEDLLPKSKRLITGPNTRIFIYFNGHGGNGFFKIQDTDLVHSPDLAKVLQEMYQKKLYKEILFMIDTCQGQSLFLQVEAPNIFMLSTSVVGESALADKTDGTLNTFLSDKFSGLFVDFLFQPNGYRAQQSFKLSEFLRYFTFDKVLSQLSFKSTSPRPLNEVLLSDFLPFNDDWLTESVVSYQWNEL